MARVAVMSIFWCDPRAAGFDVPTGKTVVLRDKEVALDYRFIPEPDLPPLVRASFLLLTLLSAGNTHPPHAVDPSRPAF